MVQAKIADMYTAIETCATIVTAQRRRRLTSRDRGVEAANPQNEASCISTRRKAAQSHQRRRAGLRTRRLHARDAINRLYRATKMLEIGRGTVGDQEADHWGSDEGGRLGAGSFWSKREYRGQKTAVPLSCLR